MASVLMITHFRSENRFEQHRYDFCGTDLTKEVCMKAYMNRHNDLYDESLKADLNLVSYDFRHIKIDSRKQQAVLNDNDVDMLFMIN